MDLFNFHHHFPTTFGIYNLNFKEEVPDIPFSAGIHPKDILDENEEQWQWLKTMSSHKNCLAIGECGLDGLIEVKDTLQKEVFRQQIQLANYLKKPVIIHCVRKFHELKIYKTLAETPLIIHGFNKKTSVGLELINEGFYLSFGSSLLHNVDLQGFFKQLPANLFFLETDDKSIPTEEIYLKAAALREISLESLTVQISDNLKEIGILL